MKLAKRIVLLIVTIIFCVFLTSCVAKDDTDEVVSVKSNSEEDETKEEDEEETEEVDRPEDAIEAEQMDSNDETSTKSQEDYLDFILDYEDISGMDLLFYEKEDMNLDGIDEVVIAVGVANEYLEYNYVDSIYILNDNSGNITLFDVIKPTGYYSYEVKLIELQDSSEKYLYYGVTNGVQLYGFSICEIGNGEMDELCYSASASGVGEDKLIDDNNDGKYDRYVQYRTSYDVLYYTVISTYDFNGDSFTLSNRFIGLDNYPSTIKDTIIEYLALKVLDIEESPEAIERLAQICVNGDTYTVEAISLMEVLDVVQGFDGAIQFEIEENGDTATVMLIHESGDTNDYQYLINMVKTNEQWHINNITSVNH